MGESGNKAVSLVGQLFKINPDYSHYQYLLATGADVKGKELLQQLAQVCQEKTPIDFIFQAIPSFTSTPEATIAAIKAYGGPVPPDLYSIAAFPLENAKYGIGNLPWYQYKGLIDYMVTNQWCMDYARFCDRMNGVISPFNQASLTNASLPTYPMAVPTLDWLWMIGGFLTMVACIGTYVWGQQARQSKTSRSTTSGKANAERRLKDRS